MIRVLSALLLAGAGWLWWHSAKVSEFKPADTPRPSANNASNAAGSASGAHREEREVNATAQNQSPEAARTTNERPPSVSVQPPSTNPGPMPIAAFLAQTNPVAPATNLFVPVTLEPGQRAEFSAPAAGGRILEMQIVLARMGLSPGSIDGVFGSQTRAALQAYYQKLGLRMPPEAQAAHEVSECLDPPALTETVIASRDFARLRPLGRTWLEKSQQDRLDYESILELIAERGRAHPNLIRRLNPGVNWANLAPGTRVRLPAIEPPLASEKAAYLRVLVGRRALQAVGSRENLLAHFPCSIAQRVEKRPVGETLHVIKLVREPNYTFDPDVFPESTEARELGRKLLLQPGPNNPVGAVWIGLDKPGYGIHGTPRPEDVGRTESHGCFRLANWNAELLFQLAWVGLPVRVEP